MRRQSMDDIEDGLLGNIVRLKTLEMEVEQSKRRMLEIAREIKYEGYPYPAYILDAIDELLTEKRIELAKHRGE